MTSLVETREVEIKTVPKTRREILLDAAALIEEHGWTLGPKGVPGHTFHDGRLCMLGGIAKAMRLRDGDDVYKLDEPYWATAKLVFHNTIDVNPMRIYEWNDELGSDGQKKVTTALRKLADGASWEEATS